MKGMIFTEFLEMVDAKFGPETTERILEGGGMPHGGVYTAVGTYDHQEILDMVGQLSQITGVPVPDLVKAYGRHLFGALTKGHGRFLVGIPGCLEFLENVERYVHVEVLKLYQDAQLPHLTYTREGQNTLEMIYTSSRPFGDLAEGLILGCAEHFGERVTVDREGLPAEFGCRIRFRVERHV